MGPLSAKQHREYLKLNSQEQREKVKMEQDQGRKQQLHEIKLQEAAAKANQSIGHKEQMQQVKLKDAQSPLSKPPKINRQKLGLPSTNPMAGTEMFKQGQHKLEQGTDTVPAMLTPGEAVIPEPAAQDPKNKEVIQRMVEEGREANMLRDGAVQVTPPSLAYRHYDVPGSSFMHGTTEVFSRGSSDQANYEDGTTGVSWLDNLLQKMGVQTPVPAPVVVAPPAPVAPIEVPVNTIPTTVAPAVIPVATTNVEAPPVVIPVDIPSVSTGVNPGGAGKRGAVPTVTPGGVGKRGFVDNFDITVPESSKYQYKMPVDPTFNYGDAFTKKNESGVLGAFAANPLSSAKGLYQMTDAAWTDAIKENSALKYADRANADVQEQGRQAYKNVLAKQLSKKGIEPNDASIAKAWVVGAEGLKNIFKGDPNSTLSLSKEAIAKNPNLQGKTNADFINDPNPYSRVGKDAILVTNSKLRPPSGREILIAKQDLATSTNKDTRLKAEEMLAKAKQTIPTLADNRNTIKAEPLASAPFVPINDLERSRELSKDPNISANDRAFFEQEVKRLEGEVPKLVGVSEPNNRIQQFTGSNTFSDKVVPPISTEANDAVARVSGRQVDQIEPTEVPKIVDAPSLIETNPVQANKAIADISQKQSIQIDKLREEATTVSNNPKEQESWLAKQIGNLFGDTGLFNDKELIRFAIVAAGGMLSGGSTGGSLRYAGVDALKAGDSRRNAQAVAAAEDKKNTRELLEKLDGDYRTALGENVPASIRLKAIELRNSAKTPDSLRAVIQLLKANKSVEDTTGSSKPKKPDQGFFDGKPMEYREQGGNIQKVNNKGEWENIPPADLKRFETRERRDADVKKMTDANVNRLTPILLDNFKSKEYTTERAKLDAARYAEALNLLKEDLGPNISATSFAVMSENTIRSAIESAKINGKAINEEGLRKAFFGNAVIETKMVTNNKELYMAKDSKNKFVLPATPYQTALGTAIDTYKKQGISIDKASNAIENDWKSLPTETKNKFTDMSKGAPGSTPMLFWLQQTGGKI